MHTGSFKDFEHARMHIKALIKPEAILGYEFARDLGEQEGFSRNLYCGFDCNSQFRFLSIDDVKNGNRKSVIV